MSTDGGIAIQTPAEMLEKVVVGGDLSKLTAQERLQFYSSLCASLGLNPLTRPFSYITLSGKLTLYATRDATDQLRKLHTVSIERLEREVVEGIYCVTAYAKNAEGRTDMSLGAVSIEGLKGEARANCLMKAETKSKRRVTLSICGLGLLDETEVETIPGALVGEPEAPPHDQDTTDRLQLVAQIDTDARYLGLMRSEYKALWARHIGATVTKEQARIADLMAMGDELAGLVKARQKGAQAEAPLGGEIPF